MKTKFNQADGSASGVSIARLTSNAGTERPAADEILPEGVLPIRLKTVALLTEVSEKTVRRWIQSGLLRSHKLGGARVVRRWDLRSFLDQQAGETKKEEP